MMIKRKPVVVPRVLCVLGILVLSEIVMRIVGQVYLSSLYVKQNQNNKVTPDRVNILCLGESSTAGLGVEPQQTYPARLQELLRQAYPQENIETIVPPHVGQNTSQVANRINQYIAMYRPKLMIMMLGYNNEWSLAESHVGKFLSLTKFENVKIKILIGLNNLRIFKLFRFLYLQFVVEDKSKYLEGLKDKEYIWGGPELVRYPPSRYAYDFALRNREAFVKLWHYDLKEIIALAKVNNIPVVLMTYHINPTYLPVSEWISLSRIEGIPLVRNDVEFDKLREEGMLGEYLLNDKWHPNAKGYQLIAQNVFAAIKQYYPLDK
jgi:lysophospholipase L1-like esterase